MGRLKQLMSTLRESVGFSPKQNNNNSNNNNITTNSSDSSTARGGSSAVPHTPKSSKKKSSKKTSSCKKSELENKTVSTKNILLTPNYKNFTTPTQEVSMESMDSSLTCRTRSSVSSEASSTVSYSSRQETKKVLFEKMLSGEVDLPSTKIRHAMCQYDLKRFTMAHPTIFTKTYTMQHSDQEVSALDSSPGSSSTLPVARNILGQESFHLPNQRNSVSRSRSRSRSPIRPRRTLAGHKPYELMLKKALPDSEPLRPPDGPTKMPITHLEAQQLAESQLNSRKNTGAASASSSRPHTKKSGVIVKGKKKGKVAKIMKKGRHAVKELKNNAGFLAKQTGIIVKPGQPSVRRPLPKYVAGLKIDEDWLWRLCSLYRCVKATNNGLLSKVEYEAMCDTVLNLFKSEGVLHNIKVPENGNVTIIGDLHGHFDDFLTILQSVGMPSATNLWIFNGDVVDRGPKQIISMVFFMKIAYPKYVFLTRGNHECRSVNQTTQPRGFKSVVSRAFQADLWHRFLRVFDVLPIVAIINDIVMVVHGGLPRKAGGKNAVKLSDIAKIRKEDVGDIEAVDSSETTFMLNEMLWNDSSDCRGFEENSRGPGTFLFGPDVTTDFLKRNKLKLLIRSHDVRDGGYEIEHAGQLVTVFSAPHYCGLDNSAAFVHLPGKLLTRQSWEFGPELIFCFEARPIMEEHDCAKLRELRQRIAYMSELFKKQSKSSRGSSPGRRGPSPSRS